MTRHREKHTQRRDLGGEDKAQGPGIEETVSEIAKLEGGPSKEAQQMEAGGKEGDREGSPSRKERGATRAAEEVSRLEI